MSVKNKINVVGSDEVPTYCSVCKQVLSAGETKCSHGCEGQILHLTRYCGRCLHYLMPGETECEMCPGAEIKTVHRYCTGCYADLGATEKICRNNCIEEIKAVPPVETANPACVLPTVATVLGEKPVGYGDICEA
jgi:predicted nucleic acid-binding Zn ribbon protein